ncbi:hypothetical protein D9M69_603780 [compost metagenome]
MLLRLPDQHLQSLQIQPAVGLMSDGFRLHRRVDIDPLQRFRPSRSDLKRCLDTRLQQFLQPLRPNPLAPARHRARVDRRFVLEELKAAEELPIRILHPALDPSPRQTGRGHASGNAAPPSAASAWRGGRSADRTLRTPRQIVPMGSRQTIAPARGAG